MRKRTIFLIFILIYYVIKHYKTFENEKKQKKNKNKRKKTKNDALKILGDAFFIVTKRHLTQKNTKKH
jgi:hypothetical protein